ncbi:MAG: DUF4386 domain-containing protein [Myxococcales bacterium]|nr:DUF4386 domain-containing protein [Myxococcales bacterium]MCB9644760.1 DUF4386 domain-containing protein [Myxococcales bacterium]
MSQQAMSHAAPHNITASSRQAALLSGISLLLMAVFAGIAVGIFGKLVVPQDATATAKNILGAGSLFRMGILSWFVILCLDLLVSWSLYVFFRPMNQGLSLLGGWLRLLYTALLGASWLQLIAALRWSEHLPANLSGSLASKQLLLSIQTFQTGWDISLAVFGAHLFVLGYISLKSGLVPKWIGLFLCLACVGYMTNGIGTLISPSYGPYKAIVDMIFFVPMLLGELGLAIWMLVRNKRFAFSASPRPSALPVLTH